MAVTINLYNHTRKRFANAEIDLSALKVMLVLGYSFDASETIITNAEAAQVAGNGWPLGGASLAGAAITQINGDEAMLDAPDLERTASGGSIGPADGAVIYQDLLGQEFPLLYVDFGREEAAGSGFPFKLVWNPSGIVRWLEP